MKPVQRKFPFNCVDNTETYILAVLINDREKKKAAQT